jgi:hypothetical protein
VKPIVDNCLRLGLRHAGFRPESFEKVEEGEYDQIVALRTPRKKPKVVIGATPEKEGADDYVHFTAASARASIFSRKQVAMLDQTPEKQPRPKKQLSNSDFKRHETMDPAAVKYAGL